MTVKSGGEVNRILVATDLSTRSDRALRRATLIAKRLGSTLCLVHVVEGDQPDRMVETEHAAASVVLADTIRTSCDVDGVPAHHQIMVDDVTSGILAAADELGADLIVLGPHRSRFRDVFAGTTVERVLRRSRLPLLVAIQTPSAFYERALLALDFDDASRAAARGALSMGLFDRTTVTLMHAFDAPAMGMMQRSMELPDTIESYVDEERAIAEQRLRQLSDDLELPATRQEVVVITGSPSRSIIDSAHDRRADLIVLGTSKMGGAKRMLIGSVAEQVVRDAERDILVIPADHDIS